MSWPSTVYPRNIRLYLRIKMINPYWGVRFTWDDRLQVVQYLRLTKHQWMSAMTTDGHFFFFFFLGSARKLDNFLGMRRSILKRNNEGLDQPWRGMDKRENCDVMRGWVSRAKGPPDTWIQGLPRHQYPLFVITSRNARPFLSGRVKGRFLDPGLNLGQWVRWRPVVEGVEDAQGKGNRTDDAAESPGW